MVEFPDVETYLGIRDPILAGIIAAQSCRWDWNKRPHPVRELIRIVVSQQISTKAALTIWSRILRQCSDLGERDSRPEILELRRCGLTLKKAQAVAILAEGVTDLLDAVRLGACWEGRLKGIPGVGPWTIDIFRIMVLRDPDVLPEKDAGLLRAIRASYGVSKRLSAIAAAWQPYRSVACWYLWRSLGNPPLG